MRRDAEGLDGYVQRICPLLIPCADRRLGATELRALAMRQLLPLLVRRRTPTCLARATQATTAMHGGGGMDVIIAVGFSTR